MHRPRILIAEDHNLVAELCKKLLESEFDIVGTVSNGLALLHVALELKPDVIVVDIGMPGLNGLDAARQVKKMCPKVKVMFLTVNDDPEVAAEAFRNGASGYLLKTCAASELVTAVRYVLRGNTYLSPTLPKDTVDFLRRRREQLVEEGKRLTEREVEVLQLLAQGKTMGGIGKILNLTRRTVGYHKYRMMEVLGAKSTADLVRYAVRNHIVDA